MSEKRKLSLRILVGVGAPAAVALLILSCLLLKTTPPCLFYELTGLYCFGCGAGRAFLALLRFDIPLAFRNNPLLFCFAPFLIYGFLKYYIAFVFSRDLLPLPAIRSRAFGIGIILLLVAFMILRNIPVFPFTLLAPIPPAG